VKTRAAWWLLAFLRFYKIFLSPFFGGACKFYPSCSNYAYEAIARHGARRGMVLALKRLGRCRPFAPGGFDAVPDEEESARFVGRSVDLRRTQDKK
jgi:putative membrane protein insertion efficiency factor